MTKASAAEILAQRLVRLASAGGLTVCPHIACDPMAAAVVRLGGDPTGTVVAAAWLPRTTEASCSACAWRATEARDTDDSCDVCGAPVTRSAGLFFLAGPVIVVASAVCSACMDSPDPDDEAIVDAGLVVASALRRVLARDTPQETPPPHPRGTRDPRAAARGPDGFGGFRMSPFRSPPGVS